MPVPVVILTGFLGSGKTTLLNHLLHNRGGARIGAIVNDFGSVNIDAMLLAGQVDAMVSLSNGCLCCAVDTDGLDAMLQRLAEPGLVDLIVIEASGLAEPSDLTRLMASSNHEGVAYQGMVEVVDAAEFAATRAKHPELDEHVKAADLVVLNKIDRVSDAEAVAGTVRELAAGTPVLSVEHGRVDPQMLFDLPHRSAPPAEQLTFAELLYSDDDHSGHLHARYQSTEFGTDTPIDPRALLAFLADNPAGVYRIKGFVHFGVPRHHDKFVLHSVGGFVRFERRQWASDETPRTQLVLIGAGIDDADLHERLRACESQSLCELDEQSMLGVLRYL